MKKTQTRAEFIAALDKELISFGVADRSEILSDFELHFTDSAAQGLSEEEICGKLGDITEIAAQYGDDYIRPAVAAVKRVKELPKPDEVKITKTPEIPIVLVENKNDNPLQLDTFAEIEEIIAAAPVHPETTAPELSLGDVDVTAFADTKAKPMENHAENHDNSHTKAHEESHSNQGYSFRREPSGNSNSEFKAGNLIVILLVDIFILSWVVPVIFSFIVAALTVPVSLVISGVASIVGGFLPNIPFFHTPFSQISTLLLGIAVTALGGLAALAAIGIIKLLLKILKGIVNWHSMMLIGRKILVNREAME